MACASPTHQRSTSSSRCSPARSTHGSSRRLGLTGADAGVVTVRRAAPLVTAAGESVSLGLVGSPVNNGGPRLVTDLLARGYVPVIACIGATRDGELLNVNADTLAAHLAI